jgi:hypothetical protein
VYALIAFAFVVAAALLGMSVYTKSHPPDVSSSSMRRLRRGVRLGAASATLVLLLYVAMLYFPPVSPSLFWPLTIGALEGNILNLVSLIFCLRDLNGRSLFSATLVVLGQFLWVLYAIRAVTVEF